MMKLNALITAADFLYSHSPASSVTALHDTLVIRGRNNNPLADALFSLLFTTANQPETAVRLVRLVPEGAKEAELEFICRNEEAIGAFARHEYSENDRKRQLNICFLDDEAFEAEKETNRIAWAISLDGGSIHGACCYTSEDIPMLLPVKEQWSAADEEGCKVLRIARRVHTAYTASWNSWYTEEQISADLYGNADHPAAENGWYNLRSSLRLAVSTPWKLAAAGISGNEGVPEKLYRKLNETDGKIRDLLAWQEHRSWQAFMTLDGWRMPAAEEMDKYLFRNGNDHRDKKHKLHPCLCDLLEDDWNEPHEYSLKETPIHEWSMVQMAPDGYCRMDRMSLMIHHFCKMWVISEEYKERMDSLFRELEAELLSAGLGHDGELMRHARRAENMFLRLRENETNSFAPWQQACTGFREVLDRADHAEEVRKTWHSLLTEAGAAEERNRYRDYKAIDTKIIDWLPWILTEEKICTVWKLYAADNMLENILSAIILRPECLHIVCRDKDAEDVPVKAFQRLLKRHGAVETEVMVTLQSALAGETVPVGPHDTADVTGCGELQNQLLLPVGARIVYYGNDDLQDKNGSAFFAPVYHPYDFTLTVSEVIQLREYELLSDEQDNEMLGMEDEYSELWEARQEIDPGKKSSGAWHQTITALQMAEEARQKKIWRKTGSARQPFCYTFPPEEYEYLVRSGAVHVLYELQQEKCLGNLAIDTQKGLVTCDIYPEQGETGQYEETVRELTAMLEDRRENSRYAIAGTYAGEGKPCCFLNLNDPLQVNADRIAEVLHQKAYNKAKKDAEKKEREQEEKRRARNGGRLQQGSGNGRYGQQHPLDGQGEKPEWMKKVPSKILIRTHIDAGLEVLKRRGLMIRIGEDLYRYKSLPVRRELSEAGFALEAYVYYTLFLSGKFDDIRSNVRVKDGESSAGNTLEHELDILVTRKGRVGLISCKDTGKFDRKHIGEIRMQAEKYTLNAKPILVCTRDLEEEYMDLCRILKVGLYNNMEKDPVKEIIRMLT